MMSHFRKIVYFKFYFIPKLKFPGKINKNANVQFKAYGCAYPLWSSCAFTAAQSLVNHILVRNEMTLFSIKYSLHRNKFKIQVSGLSDIGVHRANPPNFLGLTLQILQEIRNVSPVSSNNTP
jgi:hypothetical protein